MEKESFFKKVLNGLLLSVAVVLCVIFPLTACGVIGEDQALNNIEANGVIYVEGEQTVTLTGTTSAMGDAPASFKSNVGVKDVTLGGALSGKTVREITFISSDELRIVLSGSVTIEEDAAEGKITISSRAIEGGKSAYCYTWVKKPAMSVGKIFNGGSSTNKMFSCVFTLPYGSFTDYATNGGVSLVDADNGTLSVELTQEGNLKVTVKGFDPSGEEKYPKVIIAANSTTFGVEIIAYVGKLGSYPLS